MKNYERYLKTTAEEYDKETIMSFLCRRLPDRKIVPILQEMKGKKVLDAGIGTGHYTRIFLTENNVTGIDRNPHLCRLPVKVYEGGATEISRFAGAEKFDGVVSTWMTEYLSPDELGIFFAESKKALKAGGKLITTVISGYGLGFMYVTMAKMLRGIDKYGYTKKEITEKLKAAGFTGIKIINLNSWVGIPWAYLVIAQD
jgi:cyclopropane fatty-acyl-phospholipid synthase-like methyltransferase